MGLLKVTTQYRLPGYEIYTPGLLLYQGGIDSIATARPGDMAKAERHVRMALAKLSVGKPVTKAASKPSGCSVKYADG